MTRYPIGADGRLIAVIVGGPYPPEAVAEAAGPPLDGAQVWSEGAWHWPLDVAKQRRVADVNARLAAAFEGGMPYGGKALQLRELDQQNIIAKGAQAKFVLQGIGTWPGQFGWIMADNTVLPLDAAGMAAMADAADAKVTQWRFTARGHKNAILALTTEAAVLAYDIETGW